MPNHSKIHAAMHSKKIKMQFELSTWRLLRMPPAQGAWNMAVDEAILESVYSGESLPTLRLYAWAPPCLSLGYSQPFADVNLPALRQAGWQIVRRPTGGRAILHTDELTYAVIAPLQEPRVAGSVLDSYSRLSGALLQALILMGLPAEARETYQDAGAPRNLNPVCFEVPSKYEITVNGKKLIGSAQARRKEGVLQHGSLPLYGDLTRITQVLHYPDSEAYHMAAESLLQHACTVESILGHPGGWEAAADAFTEAFQTVLNLNLLPGELTATELHRTRTLVKEKYAHPSWTERV